MAPDPYAELDQLIVEVAEFGANLGHTQLDQMVVAAQDITDWLQHFRTTGNGTANELLDGIQASVLEAVAYSAMGLARSSIGAIRQEIELTLAYTFFKDHPVEWEHVRNTGDGFRLPAEVRNYHREQSRDLARRIDLIDHVLPLSLSKLYRILSAHIHGQSPYTIPRPTDLPSMVKDEAVMESVVEMQRAVSGALSFYLVAVYAKDWMELPAAIVSRVAKQIPDQRRPEFFM
jgi:hypothetical protein